MVERATKLTWSFLCRLPKNAIPPSGIFILKHFFLLMSNAITESPAVSPKGYIRVIGSKETSSTINKVEFLPNTLTPSLRQ